jgi:hypothetical protein
VILLYQGAFFGLAFAVMVIVQLTAISLTAPGAVEQLARNPGVGGLLQLAETLTTAPSTSPYEIGAFISRVIVGGLFAWFLATWTSYGEVLHQSRTRSWLALAVFTVLCTIPLWGLALVAGVFSRAGI